MSEKLEFRVNGSVFPLLAKITRDRNKLHTDRAYARSLGFSDCPAQGVFLQGQFERYIRSLDLKVEPTEYLFRFSNPVYDGDNLVLRTEEIEQGLIKVKAFSRFLREDKEVGFAHAKFLSIGEPSGSLKEPLISREYDIDEERIQNFYFALGQNPEERLPLTLVSSLIPSALLDFAEERNMKDMQYSGIQMRNFNPPVKGNFDINISLRKSPKKNGVLNVYPFRGKISQEGLLVLEADVTVFSTEEKAI